MFNCPVCRKLEPVSPDSIQAHTCICGFIIIREFNISTYPGTDNKYYEKQIRIFISTRHDLLNCHIQNNVISFKIRDHNTRENRDLNLTEFLQTYDAMMSKKHDEWVLEVLEV